MSVSTGYKTRFTANGERKIGFTRPYAPLLESGQITATIRLVFKSSPHLRAGQPLLLLAPGMSPRHAVVTAYRRTTFGQLAGSDAVGCSPDFATRGSARLSLENHYERVISDATPVEVIDFAYVAPQRYVDDWEYGDDYVPGFGPGGAFSEY